jgi:acetyl esterase/lipase
MAGAAAIAAHAQPINPVSIPGAEARVYKTVNDTPLSLFIFQPLQRAKDEMRPAIVFFFGGGWKGGTVNQFVPHCEYFAARGMVAVVVDYRVKSRHGVTPFECVADAKSAIRWVRAHGDGYGIDKNRIVAAGGSAGGHLAASTAILKGLDEANEDLKISSRPDALVLFNPALDMLELRKHFDADDKRAKEISPMQHIGQGAPPTIIFHGTADTTVPFSQATRFCEAMTQQGGRCEVVPYEGRPHGFFNYGKGDGSDYRTSIEKAEEFLIALGYLTHDPDKK